MEGVSVNNYHFAHKTTTTPILAAHTEDSIEVAGDSDCPQTHKDESPIAATRSDDVAWRVPMTE